MLKKFFLFFVSTAFLGVQPSFTSFTFPDDPILDIPSQLLLYKEAYLPHLHSSFDPQTDTVPGLKKLLSLGYAYTAKGLLSLAPDGESDQLLNKFWQETAQAIEENKITIEYFKRTFFRLALLLSKHQPQYIIDKHRFLKVKYQEAEEGKWDLFSKPYVNEWPLLYSSRSPFCFEAIIFSSETQLNPSNVLNCLLDPDLTLIPSVFSHTFENTHPFARDLKNSASFLSVELLKAKNFASNMYYLPSNSWKEIKTLMRLIREEARSHPSRIRLADAILFLMLEKLPLNFDNFLKGTTLHSFSPVCAKSLIKHWIDAQVKEYEEEEKESPDAEIASWLTELFVSNDLSLDTGYESMDEARQANAEFTIAVKYAKKSEREECQLVELMRVKTSYEVFPWNQDYNKAVLSNFRWKARQNLEDRLLNHNALSHYSFITLKDLIEEKLSAAEIYFWTLERKHQFTFWQVGHVINEALGYNQISEKASFEEMLEGIKAAYQEFYEWCAPFLSTEPLHF